MGKITRNMMIVRGLIFTCLVLISTSAYAKDKSMGFGGIGALNVEYIPIEPQVAKNKIEVLKNGNMIKKDIRTLTKEEQLKEFGDIRIVVQLAKVNSSGSLSYLTGSISGKKGEYVAFMDFSNYFIDDIIKGTEIIGKARIGIGLRLIAKVKTKKRGIDLGSILKIGFAANRGEVSGKLEVRAMGITSQEIISELPGTLPNLDESSVQTALESMAVVKSKIYDSSTSIKPRVLAVALYPGVDIKSLGFKADK